MRKYDTVVMIGRFNPFTVAHAAILRKAVDLGKEVIIIIGSADQPRSYKNPFTAKERRMMIDGVLDQWDSEDSYKTRVHIEFLRDYTYNDTKWATKIQGIVSKYRCLSGSTAIIGHKKDESSFYLDMFPQWEFVETGLIEPLHASNVRDLYFRSDANLKFIRSVVPSNVFTMLEGWVNKPEWQSVVDERVFAESYKKAYASLPYPPIFLTSDAMVVCSGHVLMIKRRALPGKGLWALPGGYVNANTDKSVRSAMIRELREETGLKIPDAVLIGSIKRHKLFDAIGRDERGRIVTSCYRIDLKDGDLPKVKGSDDAEKAVWIPIADIKPDQCYADHFMIIDTLLDAL